MKLRPETARCRPKLIEIDIEAMETAPSRVLNILDRLSHAGESWAAHPLGRTLKVDISRLYEADRDVFLAWIEPKPTMSAPAQEKGARPGQQPTKVKLSPRLGSDPRPPQIEV